MRKKAFTLIELLVVISILALLMAILLPTLQRVREQGKAVVCQSNLRQWAVIFKMYTDAHDARLPEQEFWGLATPNHWMYTMREHAVGTEDIRCCPMATKLADPIGQGSLDLRSRLVDPGVTGRTLLAWGKFKLQATDRRSTPYYYGSYGFNSWLAVPPEGPGFIIGGPGQDIRANFWKTTNVDGAAEVPVFLDSWWWCAWVKSTDDPPAFADQKTPFPCGCSDSIRRFCINRHHGFVNATFLDYSVRKVGLKELWTLKWHRQFLKRNRWTKLGGVRPQNWPEWMRHFKDY